MNKWDSPVYKDLKEHIESLVVTNELMGQKIKYNLNSIPSTDSYNCDLLQILTRKDNGRIKCKLHIKLFENTLKPEMHIIFYDKSFKTKGLKGNLKNEGFIWSCTSSDSEYYNYKFTLNSEINSHIKQIKRLLFFFRKCI